jgi:hypothetical protein
MYNIGDIILLKSYDEVKTSPFLIDASKNYKKRLKRVCDNRTHLIIANTYGNTKYLECFTTENINSIRVDIAVDMVEPLILSKLKLL